MKPRVSFDSDHIQKRLDACLIVARAYGWPEDKIARFSYAVRMAFCYEGAMEIISEEFEI